MEIHDLTYPVGPSTPVYPGDEPVRVTVTADLERGDAYAARRLELGSHSGTHVDAPAHLVRGGATVDRLPAELWVGPALLLDREEFDGTPPPGTSRLLLSGCPDGIPLEWARAIVATGVRLVGIDGPSFDPIGSTELPVHRVLLGAEVVLVESLRLEGAPRGPGVLYCLPLPVAGGDGAPARVLWHTDARHRPRAAGKWGTNGATSHSSRGGSLPTATAGDCGPDGAARLTAAGSPRA